MLCEYQPITYDHINTSITLRWNDVKNCPISDTFVFPAGPLNAPTTFDDQIVNIQVDTAASYGQLNAKDWRAIWEGIAILNFDPSLAPRIYYSEGDFELWEENPPTRIVTGRMRVGPPVGGPANNYQSICHPQGIQIF